MPAALVAAAKAEAPILLFAQATGFSRKVRRVEFASTPRARSDLGLLEELEIKLTKLLGK